MSTRILIVNLRDPHFTLHSPLPYGRASYNRCLSRWSARTRPYSRWLDGRREGNGETVQFELAELSSVPRSSDYFVSLRIYDILPDDDRR